MKPWLRPLCRCALLLGGLLFTLLLSGCGTVGGDARNASARPWNSPKGWESGLPAGMNEGR